METAELTPYERLGLRISLRTTRVYVGKVDGERDQRLGNLLASKNFANSSSASCSSREKLEPTAGETDVGGEEGGGSLARGVPTWLHTRQR